MVALLRTTWDSLTAMFLPPCVWGGQIESPTAGPSGKAGKSSNFRLSLEVLEPRMALAANPLVEPLAPAPPFVLADLPYGDQELRTEGAVLGSSVVNITQQAEAPHRTEARNTSGLVVVVFSLDAGPETLDLFAQRYDAAGAAQGEALRINQATHSRQEDWSVAIAKDGDFVVAWKGIDQQGAGPAPGIYVRRFGANGAALADETQANQTAFTQLNRPDVATTDDLFVVAWSGLDGQGQGGVYARQFDMAGTAMGDEIQVSADPAAAQQAPAVAVAQDDQFVVGYVAPTGESGRAIFVQRFAADGSASGGALQLTVSTQRTPILHDLAIDAGGNLLVTWSVPGWDGVQATSLKGVLATGVADAGNATALPAEPTLALTPGSQRITDLLRSAAGDNAESLATQEPATAGAVVQGVAALNGGQPVARFVPSTSPGSIVDPSGQHALRLAAPISASMPAENDNVEQGTPGGSAIQRATATQDHDRQQTSQQQGSSLPTHDSLLDAPLSETSLSEAILRPASPHPRRKPQQKPK